MARPAWGQATSPDFIFLPFDRTAELGAMVFGQGIEGVTTASTGATTAGGTITWAKYREQTDHLGMRHVYFQQQYNLTGAAAPVPIFGTSIALHYAPDGSLRWAIGGQYRDVTSVSQLNIPSPEQAFNAAQTAAASWPGFNPGDPQGWGAGVLAQLIARAELSLTSLEPGLSLRPVWRLPTYDVHGRVFSLRLDATTGQLLSVSSANPPVTVDCSPDSPYILSAWAKPENPYVQDDLPDDPYRAFGDVVANYRPVDNEPSCGGVPCTHEAVWKGTTDSEPQIEVYHGLGGGVSGMAYCWDPTHDDEVGNYAPTGLKVVNGAPSYEAYGGLSKGLDDYRFRAGDAMYFTRSTMVVFINTFERSSFDGMGGRARVVVDAFDGCRDNMFFNREDVVNYHVPTDAVLVCRRSASPYSASAALDLIAHEWGHGVSKYGADFFDRKDDYDDTGEMEEGFADVVGHAVEWLSYQGTQYPLREFEGGDWKLGEDWDPDSPAIRGAHEYDPRDCHPAHGEYWHYSMHMTDPGCEPDPPPGQPSYPTPAHSNGNRLAVVYRLMAEGGINPACANVPDCEEIVVDPPLWHAGAAKILFRVLESYADSNTNYWDHLAFLAVAAAYDLYAYTPEVGEDVCAYAIQNSVREAFLAVGFNQGPPGFPPPGLLCPPPCPPVYESCPPPEY